MKSATTENDVLTSLGAAVRGEGGVRAFGRKYGFSASFISQVLAGNTPPSDRLCQAVGYRKVVRYEPVFRKSA